MRATGRISFSSQPVAYLSQHPPCVTQSRQVERKSLSRKLFAQSRQIDILTASTSEVMARSGREYGLEAHVTV